MTDNTNWFLPVFTMLATLSLAIVFALGMDPTVMRFTLMVATGVPLLYIFLAPMPDRWHIEPSPWSFQLVAEGFTINAMGLAFAALLMFS